MKKKNNKRQVKQRKPRVHMNRHMLDRGFHVSSNKRKELSRNLCRNRGIREDE